MGATEKVFAASISVARRRRAALSVCAWQRGSGWLRLVAFPESETIVVDVVLRIDSGIDVEPGAHAPMVQLGRLTVGRHRAGVADAVFVCVRSDARHFLPLARGQCESDLRPAGLHGLLRDMSGRSGAQERDGLLSVSRVRQPCRPGDAERSRQKPLFHGSPPRRHLLAARSYRRARAQAFDVWTQETCARKAA